MLAHAISSTKPTAPRSATSAGRTCSTTSLCMPATTIWRSWVLWNCGLPQARRQAVHLFLALLESHTLLDPGHHSEPGGLPLEVTDIARQDAPGVDIRRHAGVRSSR